ncbi:MAG: tRNA (adenosine(37)-N6)-dimethylallyltransferase MiaA [Bacteroidaceae bacterium]|nr:tRNA (adenosine(37)-N6)-dimethylallyltransferase MiaA [Bacteroidaceae bacterium]
MSTLIVILGPTGVGKTAFSLQLAEHFGCPIINADSRQIYRDLPIGTAAPTASQLARVPHYFVGTHALDENYSAAQFRTEAREVLHREFLRRDVMIVSGGAMLYIDALVRGIDDLPTVSSEVRQLLQGRLQAEGAEALRAELRLIDPAYYSRCDLRNTKRIVHALEIYYQSGRPYSSFLTAPSGISQTDAWHTVLVGLNRPREELFSRINRRAEEMVEDGLIDECRRVLPFRAENSLNTVGYKEMFQVLDGAWELPFALARMQKNTRVYAKKQLTWFKRDTAIHWFHPDRAMEQFLALWPQVSGEQ